MQYNYCPYCGINQAFKTEKKDINKLIEKVKLQCVRCNKIFYTDYSIY